MYTSRFESLGVYLPEKEVTTRELIDSMKQKPAFDIEAITGIKTRRWRSDSENSYSLAINAVNGCLKNSRYEAKDLDVIIFTSITRFKDDLTYCFEPSMSGFIKKELGFQESAMNFDITNACAGMCTGLYILNNMIRCGAVKNGMVVSGECITPITETALKEICEPIDEQFASLTVGDSGAAFILERSDDVDEGIESVDFITLGEYADLCFGMPSVKNSGVAMYTRAIDIHHESIKRLPIVIEGLFKKYGKTMSDIDFAIPHQTSIKAVMSGMKECAKRLEGIMPDVLFCVDKYGNTSSTSHFVVLHHYLKEKKIKKGSRIILLSQASGLVLGFIFMTIGELEVN